MEIFNVLRALMKQCSVIITEGKQTTGSQEQQQQLCTVTELEEGL